MARINPIADDNKSVGYWWRIGVWPLFLLLIVLTFSLFIFNMSMQLDDMDYYGVLSDWYINIGFIAFLLVIFVMSRDTVYTYKSVVFDDPNRSWKDAISVVIGVFGGVGTWALLSAGLPFTQVIKIPEPMLQLIVATTEEIAFRFAFPAIIYIFLHDTKINLSSTISYIIAILISAAIFSLFHYASYTITIENAKQILTTGYYNGMPLTMEQEAFFTEIATQNLGSTLLSAFFFAILQSGAYLVAVRVFNNGGEWAILGVIGGHYIWNLLMLSYQKGGETLLYNPWHYLGVFLLVIFFLQFSLGYFFNTKTKTVMHSHISRAVSAVSLNKRKNSRGKIR